jgi:transposase-like protein
VSQERQATDRALLEPGASVRAIAAVLGYGKTTVHRDLRADGHVPSGRSSGLDGKTYSASRESHRELVGIALAALEQGKTPAEVTTTLGISPRTLRRWRRQWRLE